MQALEYSRDALGLLSVVLAIAAAAIYVYGSVRISYAICLTGRIPAAAARTARGVGCRGSTAR
jgi:hypothetical protein